MKSLPETIRQGFITAKAVRLFGVCAPEFDMIRFGVVEDLAIEDYITSHSLKNCLLNKMQQVHQNRIQVYGQDSDSDSLYCGSSTIDTYCKYDIAHCIIDEFMSNLIKKKMPIWHKYK